MHVRHASPAPRDPAPGPADDHPITPALRLRTCQIIAERFRLENERACMDRVTEKLKQAAGVAPRANASLEAEADKLIARESEFEKRKVQAFKPHYAVLDNRHREMDQLEDALQIIGNADPLEGSGDGLNGQQQSEPEPAKIAVAPPLVRLGPNPSVGEPLRPGMTPAHTMRWVETGETQEAGETPATTFQG